MLALVEKIADRYPKTGSLARDTASVEVINITLHREEKLQNFMRS